MTTNEYMSADELGVQNHICLLPYGKGFENAVKDWTTDDLKPYQSYVVNGEAVDTMFKGLIFTPITGRGHHFITPMYAHLGDEAQKKDWKIAIKRLFQFDYNFGAAAQNTKDGQTTDIWVTLPYPIFSQTNFGVVNGEDINFKEEDNRFLVVKWWIDKFINCWNMAKKLHNKLTFRGFVWPRASIDSSDEELVKKVTDYIRTQDVLSLWLQQYGSTGCVNWKEFGFDAACTHPNFFGTSWPDFTWIANTTVFARHYHTGFQISFGKGLLFKENHLLDYLNYGVYNEYMNDSLLVFEFPNQTMKEIIENHPVEYNYLYSFIKKNYVPVYPTAAFPS
ncbi:hypothetical protein GCM10008967_19100 [Bacillus carboniphilus]|uniref:DUF4855 domain-containing protein n=1 Tax=Bacillus carboniphilus TaxID=86663 RepID=A0ABN0W8C4_9BACI